MAIGLRAAPPALNPTIETISVPVLPRSLIQPSWRRTSGSPNRQRPLGCCLKSLGRKRIDSRCRSRAPRPLQGQRWRGRWPPSLATTASRTAREAVVAGQRCGRGPGRLVLSATFGWPLDRGTARIGWAWTGPVFPLLPPATGSPIGVSPCPLRSVVHEDAGCPARAPVPGPRPIPPSGQPAAARASLRPSRSMTRPLRWTVVAASEAAPWRT